MRGRFVTILASLALATVLPGCGGSNDTPATEDNGTTTSPTEGTTTPPETVGPRVGSVLTVVLPDAFVQGSQAFDDDPIRAGQSVSTNAGGSVDFGLDQKLEKCRLFQDSEVVAAPAGGILLRYQRGTALCFTTADPSIALTVGPSDVEFAMSDPLFGVTVTGEQLTLRVVQGVVDVRSSAPEGGGPLLVGPGQQVTVVGGNVPSTAEDFNSESLPRDQRETVSEFRQIIPPPNFDPPDPADSPGLQRILAQIQTIRVGIDSRFAGDPVEETETPDWDFADAFFLFLASHWGIDSSPMALQPKDADSALQDGAIDVFITPEPSSEFGSFPLFGGLEARTWSVSFVAADELLGSALRDFVRASLQGQAYVITYSQAFGVDHPPLEPLRSLLGL
ncbi:MAG: hypothetical protein ACRDGU_09690 [Actinomycetota bacterium]